jgi:hypothetical protein
LVFYRVGDRHAGELCRSIRNQVQLRLSEPGDASLARSVAFDPPSQKETARV